MSGLFFCPCGPANSALSLLVNRCRLPWGGVLLRLFLEIYEDFGCLNALFFARNSQSQKRS